MGFLDNLISGASAIAGNLGRGYRELVRGDQHVGNPSNRVLKPAVGRAYATDENGNVIPNKYLGDNFEIPSPLSTSQPIKISPQPRRLAVEQYQGMSSTPIPSPNQEITDLLFKYIPEDATKSATIIAGENGSYNHSPSPNLNNDGTYDNGLSQINTKTFADLLAKAKYAQQLRDYGIKSIADAQSSPEKGVQAFKVARDYEKDAGAPDASWWYGWQNKGYTIDPNRTLEQIAENPTYFKLREFLARQ